MKKRFPLTCLAWLTCEGPSAPRANSSDPDIQALKEAGFTTEWLEQGTPENIESISVCVGPRQRMEQTPGITGLIFMEGMAARAPSCGSILHRIPMTWFALIANQTSSSF